MGQSNLKKKNLHGTQVPFKMPLKDNQSEAIGLGQSNLTKKKKKCMELKFIELEFHLKRYYRTIKT